MAPTRPLATPLRASAPSWGLPPPHPRPKCVTFHQVRDNQHSAGLSHGSPLRGCALLRSPPLRGSLLIGGVATWRHYVGWRCPSSGRCPRKVVSSRWSDTFGRQYPGSLTIRGLLPFACSRHSPTCPHSAPKAVFGRATHHQDYLSATAKNWRYVCAATLRGALASSGFALRVCATPRVFALPASWGFLWFKIIGGYDKCTLIGWDIVLLRVILS